MILGTRKSPYAPRVSTPFAFLAKETPRPTYSVPDTTLGLMTTQLLKVDLNELFCFFTPIDLNF